MSAWVSAAFLASYGLDFFAAGSAFIILEKLQGTAAFVFTINHEACAALLTFFLYKGLPAAGRAGYIQRPSAPRAHWLPFLNRPITGGTVVSEWIHAAASGTEPGISINEGPAVEAGLLISRHSLFLQSFAAAAAESGAWLVFMSACGTDSGNRSRCHSGAAFLAELHSCRVLGSTGWAGGFYCAQPGTALLTKPGSLWIFMAAVGTGAVGPSCLFLLFFLFLNGQNFLQPGFSGGDIRLDQLQLVRSISEILQTVFHFSLPANFSVEIRFLFFKVGYLALHFEKLSFRVILGHEISQSPDNSSQSAEITEST